MFRGGHGEEGVVGGGTDEGIRYLDRWTVESFTRHST